MNELWKEAEGFETRGGWIVDQQSMETLHSSYLMAHGLGIPVEDAVGELEVKSASTYAVWVLTRDWTAVWNIGDSAGKFTLKVDGKELPAVLGTNGKEWAWQKAGEVYLSEGKHTLSLHDLTGFNGRCDAVYLTDSGKTPPSDRNSLDEMRRRLNWKEIKDVPEIYDLIVVGGGVAGICTALSALRSGVRTLLIHDRGVLGGCNSSEVRVCMGGETNFPPYEKLGNVVNEIAPIMGSPSHFDAAYYEDDRKRFAFEIEGWQDRVLLHQRVTDAQMENGRITSVVCTDVLSGKKTRFHARLFSDCSGDATLARLAGCRTMYGRESRDRFGEGLAPWKADRLVMGHSLRWYTEKSTASAFPDIDWGLEFDDDTCLNVYNGDWEQETGFSRDMVDEIEIIRDFGLRAILSNWSYQKNHYKHKEAFADYALKWVSPIGGKRESYRVEGDYILRQQDLEELRPHEDGTACMTWSIDLHYPEPDNEARFGEAFRSFAYHRGLSAPYPVPYRCLYAKDVKNLFLGGRIVSASHVAFSSIRVMRTLGELGEVVGMAAGVCKRNGCEPRDVYESHLSELKEALKRGITVPHAFGCGYGAHEAYHFKDVGWFYLNHPEDRITDPEKIRKFKRGIAYLGIEHQNPLPDWFVKEE